jgi:hypothetical protein
VREGSDGIDLVPGRTCGYDPIMARYPFTPINIDGLEDGHYWDIRMEGRFGFGVVIGRWNRVGVLAGILTLVKQNNTISPEDTYTIFETGYVDLKSIAYCGGQNRGRSSRRR